MNNNEIMQDKQWRKDLDRVLQEIPASSRELSLARTKLQEAIMWLGMDLKRLSGAMPPATLEDAARAAYARYGAVTDFKNFMGNPMPKWEELTDKIREAWKAAANPAGNPYPESYNPNSARVEPTADGLKL